MREWEAVLRFVRDNITLIVFLTVVFIMGAAWIVFEALRSHRSREEVFRLQQKIRTLERERAAINPDFTDPMVLTNRWVASGGAATTADGGCLLYIDRVAPDIKSAELTLRVDGEAVVRNHALRVGERLETPGKNGTYTLKLFAVDGIQANLGISLRSRHKDVEM